MSREPRPLNCSFELSHCTLLAGVCPQHFTIIFPPSSAAIHASRQMVSGKLNPLNISFKLSYYTLLQTASDPQNALSTNTEHLAAVRSCMCAQADGGQETPAP